MLSQVAGLGLGVAGLSKLKGGGVVQEPTSNGIIDLAMHKMEEDYA
jgi:hypothetical protein